LNVLIFLFAIFFILRSSSNDSSDTFASLSRKSNATLGALLTHSSSPKNNLKGPRTPPISERTESKSLSPGFEDTESRKFSVESVHSLGIHERFQKLYNILEN
jgi:hypothetical protein